MLLDLTIPGGRGGREIAGELRDLQPGLKIILSSGYTGDPILTDFRDTEFDAVLTKPYALEELREVLDDTLKES